jgi:hypothetical protein
MMILALLHVTACTPLPVEGFYDFLVLADEDSCGETEQPSYSLGRNVLEFVIADVSEDKFDLTLIPGAGEDTTLTCSMSDQHFNCGVSFELEEGWTDSIAAGGAWLSEDEASLYWGMFQDCDWGGARCTREYTCSIFQQFHLMPVGD